ncbi:MAG: S9 family peptidase, partial [Planctomycetaceae bacterium]
MRLELGVLLVLVLAAPLLAAGRPMMIEDLLAVKSVSDPQVSPDGLWVVYVVGEIDRAADKMNSDLWLVPLAGGAPRRL